MWDSAVKAPAAWAVYNYSNGAPNSWYLPSQDELNQLCKYANGQSTAVADQATVCANSNTLQSGFTNDFYWWSSQNDATTAWLHNLGHRVRADGWM